MNKDKGFILPVGQNKVSDVELLAMPKATITMMVHNRTAYEYHRWRLPVMKKVLMERVEVKDDEYDGDAVSRVNFTIKCVAFSEAFLRDYEVKD